MKRKLPIGIQTFRTVREEGFYYVDKTMYARRLVDEGKHYFLSRPRRFGKSLFVDTLKELFEGNEPLFEGLDVHDRWDWSVRHPVVRLDFSGRNFTEPGHLDTNLGAQLDAMERRAGISVSYPAGPERFAHLIEALHERTGQRVVVLVDEYDKPILDALAKPELARANRDSLRGLYSVIKFSDAHVKFTFLTGVSKFSKVSLFSGLNNLIDVTLDPAYSAICGYTEEDLDAVFAPEIVGLDRDEIRRWYNGYGWRGEEKVYNPFDILFLFRRREFRPYWFETGTPTFLVETLFKQRKVGAPALESVVAGDDLLSAFDVDHIGVEALLFQTGYLTIAGEESAGGASVYRLGYPNHEVRQSLNGSLLRAMAPDVSVEAGCIRLLRSLREHDFAGLDMLFRSFFAGIPHQWHTKNDLARYEGWYASVFYSWFAAAGLDVRVEDSSSRGRLDMAVRYNEQVYLFEFKTVGKDPEGSAMAQLEEKGYADKYRHLGQPIHLIGVEFSREERNVAAFTVKPA